MTATSAISRWSLFLGVIYILVGMIAIMTPLIVSLMTVLFFGFLLTAAGVAGLIHALWQRGWAGFAVQLLAGVLATCMGILLIFDVEQGVVVITLIMACYFLVGGFFKAGFAISHPALHHRGSLIFSGVISLILGILILAHWPNSSMWVIGTFIGIDLIFYGLSLVSASRKLA